MVIEAKNLLIIKLTSWFFEVILSLTFLKLVIEFFRNVFYVEWWKSLKKWNIENYLLFIKLWNKRDLEKALKDFFYIKYLNVEFKWRNTYQVNYVLSCQKYKKTIKTYFL